MSCLNARQATYLFSGKAIKTSLWDCFFDTLTQMFVTRALKSVTTSDKLHAISAIQPNHGMCGKKINKDEIHIYDV